MFFISLVLIYFSNAGKDDNSQKSPMLQHCSELCGLQICNNLCQPMDVGCRDLPSSYDMVPLLLSSL
ncbi:hypothetical protein ACJW31_08G041600 [Castanea mollissima]